MNMIVKIYGELMIARKLSNSDKASLESFLRQHTETSMFLLSNMQKAGLEYKGQDFEGDYFAAFNASGEILGAIAHYWNGNIIVQSEDLEVLSAIIRIFTQELKRPVAGVLGPDKQTVHVLEYLSLTSKPFSLNEDEELYALDLDMLTIPGEPIGVRVIPASLVERSVLTEWMQSYEIETLGAKKDDALVQRVDNRVNRILNGNDCWALILDSIPVSLCGFNSKLPDIVQIGPVWTQPEHRNKKYARYLVAKSLEIAKTEGVDKAILFTAGTAAAKAYIAIGFHKIGSYRLAILEQPKDL